MIEWPAWEGAALPAAAGVLAADVAGRVLMEGDILFNFVGTGEGWIAKGKERRKV